MSRYVIGFLTVFWGPDDPRGRKKYPLRTYQVGLYGFGGHCYQIWYVFNRYKHVFRPFFVVLDRIYKV